MNAQLNLGEHDLLRYFAYLAYLARDGRLLALELPPPTAPEHPPSPGREPPVAAGLPGA